MTPDAASSAAGATKAAAAPGRTCQSRDAERHDRLPERLPTIRTLIAVPRTLGRTAPATHAMAIGWQRPMPIPLPTMSTYSTRRRS